MSAESRADAASRRLVRHLRLVESIASLHRSISPNDEDDVLLQRSRAGTDRVGDAGAAGPHWGRLSHPRSHRPRDVVRRLSRVGHGAPPRSRAQAAARRWRSIGRRAHARLLEEARRLARVRHAHVVQVYGAEQHDGRVGLWMELVRGESLEQTVQSRGPFGAREAALIGLDLCAALAAVHGAGLLHRDIKAQNVMRESGGRLVLMDFGTGEELRRHEPPGRHAALPCARDLPRPAGVGSERPLQPRRSALLPRDRQLSGQCRRRWSSWRGRTSTASAAAPRSASGLAGGLHRDVERSLDSDPTRRYQSIGQFESALRESLDTPSARPAAQPVAVPRRRFGVAFAAAAAVLIALIAGLIVWSGRVALEPGVQSLAVLALVDHSSGLSPDIGDAMTEQLIATSGRSSNWDDGAAFRAAIQEYRSFG